MSSKVNYHDVIKEFLDNQTRRYKETMLALAKRAVACSGWQWLPGMKAVHSQHGGWFRLEEERKRLIGDWAEALPDFTDEATASVLLQVVRKVRGPFVYAEPKGNGWRVLRPTSDASDTGERFKVISCTFSPGSTELEALVMALETAP
jgi:hypothetical protein